MHYTQRYTQHSIEVDITGNSSNRSSARHSSTIARVISRLAQKLRNPHNYSEQEQVIGISPSGMCSIALSILTPVFSPSPPSRIRRLPRVELLGANNTHAKARGTWRKSESSVFDSPVLLPGSTAATATSFPAAAVAASGQPLLLLRPYPRHLRSRPTLHFKKLAVSLAQQPRRDSLAPARASPPPRAI